ncbi:hypothetical protein BSKO_13520 [Bryopsis sp. KO-2023]|nr:hypothetical protein BSKO_13520 [Bryopsis sp. KO-2023]
MDFQCYSDERYAAILDCETNVSEAGNLVRIKRGEPLAENELLEKVVGNLAVAECCNDTVVIRECMSDLETPDPNIQSDFLKNSVDGEHQYCDSWQVLRVAGKEPKIVKWGKKDWVWKCNSGNRLEFQIMRVMPVEAVDFPLRVPLAVQKQPSLGPKSKPSLHFKPHLAPPQHPESHVISIEKVHPEIDGSYPYSRPFVLPCRINRGEESCLEKQDAWASFGHRMDSRRVLYHVWKKTDGGGKRKPVLSESNWPIREDCSRPAHELAPREFLTSGSVEFDDWESGNLEFVETAALHGPGDTESIFARFLDPGSSPSDFNSFDWDEEAEDFFGDGCHGSPPPSKPRNKSCALVESRNDPLGGFVVGCRPSDLDWGSGAAMNAPGNENGKKAEGHAGRSCGGDASTVRSPPLGPGLYAMGNDCGGTCVSGEWKHPLNLRQSDSRDDQDVCQGFGGNGGINQGQSAVQGPAGVCSNANGERRKVESSIHSEQTLATCSGKRNFGVVGCSARTCCRAPLEGKSPVRMEGASRGENVEQDFDGVGCEWAEWAKTCNEEEWRAFVSSMFGRDLRMNDLQRFVKGLVRKLGLEKVRGAFEG